MTNTDFSAVFFDCDGVIVDSEPITNGVLRGMLHELGWDISAEECIERFVGRSFKDEAHVILEHTGVQIDEAWLAGFRARRDAALLAAVQPIAGVTAAVKAIAATGLPVACVSGAGRDKIEMQLRVADLTETFGEYVFSGMEMPRTKPAPDVYLAAASAVGVDPSSTLVIEDSAAGIQAGLAAGATVYGFAGGGIAHRSPDELLEFGASDVFTAMEQLPDMLSHSATLVESHL